MADTSEVDVVVNPYIKSWNSEDSIQNISKGKISTCGKFVALLSELNQLIVIHLKHLKYEEIITTECKEFLWSTFDTLANDISYQSSRNYVITTDNENNTIIYEILTNNDGSLYSSMITLIGSSLFFSQEGLENIESAVLVNSFYSQDGDHHRIISCINGNSLVEVTIPLNKEPLLSKFLKVVPFEDVLGSLQDKIEIIEYFDQYMYAITQRKNLYVVSAVELKLVLNINLYEKLLFHDLKHLGVFCTTNVPTVVVTDEKNQIHFIRIKQLSSIKKIRPSRQKSKQWMSRLLQKKYQSQKSINKRVEDATNDKLTHEDKEVHLVQSLGWMQVLSITSLSVSNQSLIMVYEHEANRHIVKYDLKENIFLASDLLMNQCLCFSTNQFHPLLLASINDIVIPTFNATKEELIDNIIKYSGIGDAEKICRINEWDQFSIPLHTLEVGLQHRQLDTVTFFLKSRAKVFTHYWKNLLESSSSATPSNKSFSSQKSVSENVDSDEMVNAIEMIMKSISANSKGLHKQAFFTELLSLSIDYLKKLIQDGVAAINLKVTAECDKGDLKSRTKSLASSVDSSTALFTFLFDVPESLKYLAEKLIELQTYLKKPIVERSATKDVVDGGEMNFSQEEAKKYLLNGDIGNLQGMLFKHNLQDGSFDAILKYGKTITMEYLKEKQEDKAQLVLENMGVDSNLELKEIYLNTEERFLRSYMHDLLVKKEQLSQEDIENYTYVKEIEQLYQNEDFITAAKQHRYEWNGSLFNQLMTSAKIEQDDKMDSKICMPNATNGCYCKFSISAINNWDKSIRHKVLIDGIFLSDAKKIFPEDYSTDLWEYLQSHNALDEISTWINTASDGGSCYPSLPNSLEINTSSAFVKDKIVYLLVKNAFYPPYLLDNFTELLHYLCQTKKLFHSTHPMLLYKKKISMEEKQKLYKKFNNEFAVFCQEHDLMLLLWRYLLFYKLSFVDFTKETVNYKSWFKLLLQFQYSILNHDEESTFQLLINHGTSISDESNNVATLNNLVTNNQPITALAIILLCNISKEQIFEDNHCNNPYFIEKGLLEQSLRKYPKLHTALFSSIEDDNFHNDITFYQLLQDNTDLDMKKLFSWQPLNAMALKDDNLTDLPHFSHPYLVKKYAHDVTLTYLYYVKEARPFTAYLHYMQHIENKTTLTQKERIEDEIYHVALTNHDNASIVSSCALFLSIIDNDCERLKVNVRTINLVCKYWNRKGGNEKKRTLEEVQKSMMHKLLSSSASDHLEILVKLEDAIDMLIYENKVHRFSYKAVCHWRLAVRFSRLHNLPITTRYIEAACKEDNWLQIFLFIHMYQLPQKQVINSIEKCMSNKTLLQHLVAIVTYTNETHVISSEEKKKRRKVKDKERDQRKVEKSQPRDIRAQFYSRLGTVSTKDVEATNTQQQNKDTDTLATLIPDDNNSTNTIIPSFDDITPTDIVNEKVSVPLPSRNEIPDDILDIILKCKDEVNSWSFLLTHALITWNPLIPVLAACHQSSNTLHCICIWLLCSVEHTKRKMICQNILNITDEIADDDIAIALHSHTWQAESLLGITTCLLQDGVKYTRLLYQAFHIFKHGDVLSHFLLFLDSFHNNENTSNSIKHLDRFQTEYKKNKKENVIGSMFKNESDVLFCEEFTHECILVTIAMLKFNLEIYVLVKCLAMGRYGESFKIKVLDYDLIKQSLDVIKQSNINYDFHNLCQMEGFEGEIITTLKCLLNAGCFNEASQLAELHQLPESEIMIRKVEYELDCVSLTEAWNNVQIRYSFWNNVDLNLTNKRCSSELAASFFENQASRNHYAFDERSNLLLLALKWYKRNIKENTTVNLNSLEKKIWKLKIYSFAEKPTSTAPIVPDVSTHNGNESFFALRENRTCSDVHNMTDAVIISELLQKPDVECSNNEDVSPLDNEKEELGCELLLGNLLDKGHVTEARRVAAYFQRSTIDLQIILTSMLLAQGRQSVELVGDNIKAILAETTSRHISISGMLERSGSFTQPDSLKSNITNTSSCMLDFVFIEEVQTALEKLTLRVNHGKRLCQQVLVSFKIAKILCTSYDEIVTDDYFNTLRKLLDTGVDQRRQLSKQFIKAFQVNADDVAGFIGETMIYWIKLACGEELLTSISTFNYVEPTSPSFDDVLSLVQLTENVADVGNLILETAVNLSNTSKPADRSPSNLKYEVELLVCAHYCFTISCDMDGIASILRAARHCNMTLSLLQEHTLMARLLIGVGRYRDMTDIIKSLYDQHYFEILIKKGITHEDELKTALLDFLQKYHPNDIESFKMISLGFCMYREIAQHHNTTAYKQTLVVKDQIKGAITKDLIPALHVISRTYSYAADNYIKADCYQLAHGCTRMSRLAELQVQLIASNMCVLDLTKKEVRQFIYEHQNVTESLLVAELYDMRDSSIWQDALYEHVICKGNFTYLQQFVMFKQFNGTLCMDIARKFRAEKNSLLTGNMKKLLQKLQDVSTKVKIAKELNFHDIEKQILEGPSGAYLRDRMF